MQLTYVFSELGNGLKRNLSMTIAVIVTIFVSLTLVGMGLLLNAQAHKAEDYWGSKLQITVFLCNQNSATPNCVNGEVTSAQKSSIQQVLNSNGEVASWRLQSKQEAYDKWKEAYVSGNDTERRVYQSIKPSDMQESYWVQLKNPERFQGIKTAVSGMQGVNTVRDLRDRELIDSPRWLRLMNEGARPQRLLWASTGTKDPNASDTLYIEGLASPYTVNTMPESTLHAFADHGTLGEPLPLDGGNADEELAEFEAAGVDVSALAARLQEEGKESFNDSWRELLGSLESKREALA